MAETIAKETRALLKERFPYPIFLYEAEKVGITATGEQDQNELVPERQPAAGHHEDVLGALSGVPAQPQAVLSQGGNGVTATNHNCAPRLCRLVEGFGALGDSDQPPPAPIAPARMDAG